MSDQSGLREVMMNRSQLMLDFGPSFHLRMADNGFEITRDGVIIPVADSDEGGIYVFVPNRNAKIGFERCILPSGENMFITTGEPSKEELDQAAEVLGRNFDRLWNNRDIQRAVRIYQQQTNQWLPGQRIEYNLFKVIGRFLGRR